MANVLRKLIKNARKQFNPSTVARNQGYRLNVEELEERIAPAAVALSPGEFAVWDTAAGGTGETFDTADGIIGLGSSSTAGVVVTVADITGAVGTDSATLNLTVSADTGGAVAKAIYIVSNMPIGTVDVSGLDAASTSVYLSVLSGLDVPAAVGGDITLVAGGTLTVQEVVASTFTLAGVENFASTANSGMGNITFGSYTTANTPARLTLTPVGTGAIGNITSADGDLDWSSANGASSVAAGSSGLGNITWAGDLLVPAANAIAVSSGGAIGNLSFGSVSSSAAANIGFTATTTIGTVSLGNVAGTSTGDIAFTATTAIGAITMGTYTSTTADSDLSFTATTSIASLTAGAISLANGGDLTLAATTTVGDITQTGAVGLANNSAISVTGTAIGNVSTGAITTADTASVAFTAGTTTIGNITTGAITGSSTNNVAFAATTTVGNVNMGAISLSSTGDVTVTAGTNMGNVTAASITTTAGALVTFSATTAATGTMGNVAITNSISAGNAGSTITFSANDGMGTVTVGGSIGGTAGTVLFNGDAGGTATTGNIGVIGVIGAIGDSAGAVVVTFSGANIGNITAGSIADGTGAVTFTANGTDATSGSGTIGTVTVTDNVANGAGGTGVTFTADDGIGNVSVTGDMAQGAPVTFNTNADGAGLGDSDDVGAMGTITARTLGDVTNNYTVTINTNGGATDNDGALRTVGAITVSQGEARLSITADGDVAAITVSGATGAGNTVEFVLLNMNASGDGANANIPDFAGISIEDVVGFADTLTLSGAWTIPGTMGAIVVGGGDLTDEFGLGANNINVYAGDDIADGWDAAYAASSGNINITAGNVTGTGTIRANVKAASNLMTYVKDGETFAVTVATGVTANLAFEADADNTPATNDERVTVRALAGTTSSDDFVISTTGASEFDCVSITPAADNLDVQDIRIEGDLTGAIGTASNGFDSVDTIIIEGTSAGSFTGNSLKGYAVGAGTLTLSSDVDVLALDTAADGSNDVILPAGLTFYFADSVGAATESFNHHIGVTAGAAGASATIRGIDGNGDSTANASYLFSGDGASTAQTGATAAIDPNDLISGAATISRILLSGVGGLSTDVSVREVDGTTNGSFFEFETNVGLINITTQIDSISVGIDDNSDLADNVVLTGIASTANTRNDFDRLGGGQASGNKRGLEAAAAGGITNTTAALGNFVVQSMGDPGAANFNIAVTGSTGPIILTGDTALLTPDHGSLVSNAGAAGGAIAVGGNLVGAVSIPGQVNGDILIGVGLDVNGDGDLADVTDVAPGGSINAGATITMGDASSTDILVYNDVNANIVVQSQDQDVELAGPELFGDLNGVKAGGALNNDIIVGRGLEYVIADGVNAADIFAGGDGADSVEIEGTTITGAAVLGAVNGIDSVTIIDHAVAGDVADTDVINATGGSIVVRWTAGGIGATDTVGDIYALGAMSALDITTVAGDAITVGDIITLDDGSFDVTSDGSIGTVVVADDVTVLSSEALQDLITTTDVVWSPTALDNASGDDNDMLSYSGTIDAVNAGGVIADDNVTLTADISGTMGYIVALNGAVLSGDVHAGVAIGSIVASTSIDGEFVSEGTLGLGLGTLAADMTAWGLTGVPSWFLATDGGVLAEVGDIGSAVDANSTLDMDTIWSANEAVFRAAGTAALPQGDAFWVAPAMGTIYAPAGGMAADINVGGAFGGIQVPSGVCYVELNVPDEAWIGRLIAPQFDDSSNGVNPTGAHSSWNADHVGLTLTTKGLDVVVVGAPLYTATLNVTVTGANTIAVVTGTNVRLIGGLANGSSLAAEGDLDSLTFADRMNVTSTGLSLTGGDWAGAVTVNGYLGNVASKGVIDTITVQGTIAATATLVADNFNHIAAQDLTAKDETGTLSYTNKSDTFTNLAGAQQTIFLGAARGTTATYTTVFGKLTSVQIVGKGTADFVSVVGTPTEADLKHVASAGQVGTGSGHVGDVRVMGDKLKLDDVVVQGDLGGVTVPNVLNDLWVSGDVNGSIGAKSINNAFINGSIERLTAGVIKNTTVMGSADLVGASKLLNVKVMGTTTDLYVTAGLTGGYIHDGLPTGHSNGLIKDSYFGSVTNNNFDYDADEDANTDGYILDDVINAVRIIHSFIGAADEGDEA